jgi:hypothetical protein
MSSERDLEICNMALSHLATGKEIQNLDTDESEEAASCRRFLKKVIRTAQREFPWPVFERYATLALLVEEPNSEWAYSYRLPIDCAIPLKLLSGQRVDSVTTRIPFTKSHDSTGPLIFTDLEDAELKYCCYSEDNRLFDSDFEMAISLLLAFYISPRVTAGDANRLGKRAYDAYRLMGEQAKARAANEISQEVEPECEMIAARN